MTRRNDPRSAAARGAKPPSQRQLRVGEEIRHALVQILATAHLRDPDLQDVSITVSEARVSPDLRNATVFVSPLGGGEADTLVAALDRAAGFLRGELARMVRLRHVPALRFEQDRSFDRASRLDDLLRDDRVRRDLDPDPVSGPEPDDHGA